jgi:hypothetical protein
MGCTLGSDIDLLAREDPGRDDLAGFGLVVVTLRGVDVDDAGREDSLAHIHGVLLRLDCISDTRSREMSVDRSHLARSVPPGYPRDIGAVEQLESGAGSRHGF